jgi:aspartate dehydrogenase
VLTKNESLGDIIERAHTGCRDAFDDLIRHFERNVLKTALYLTRNLDDAQDVAQEVYIKIFCHLDACDEPDRIERWIYRITINAARDFQRRKRFFLPLDVIGVTTRPRDSVFRDEIRKTAVRFGQKIHVPSGAIFGLDNLKIGKISEIKRLLLRTTKSPASLGITADTRRLIFSGKANECIKAFPKNVNVSVAMSLASGHDTDVELWVDPSVDRNVHELFIEGSFGETYIKVTNVPSPGNPATSYLAALSILSLLNNLSDPIIIGT